MLKNNIILTTPSTPDYELIDSGAGEKLERFGQFILRRPDPQALWPKKQPEKTWAAADASFSVTEKKWQIKNKKMPERWSIAMADLKFWLKLTPFKHTGIFPEQTPNWHWLAQIISSSRQKNISVLNLFGYTGAATLACLKAGASVCHVDSSTAAINWAKDNALLNKLSAQPVRWIVDDVIKFINREIKRGHYYQGIIMDPPAFGRGAKGEVWKIEKDFLTLMSLINKILSPAPLFFLINGYAAGYSPLTYAHNLQFLTEKFNGSLSLGELTISESGTKRLLPAGIFARWSKKE